MGKVSSMEVAVFPFRNLILFPNACIPMYVFEPTYIRMIKECVKNKRSIALGLGDKVHDQEGNEISGALTPKKVMGLGIPQILKQFDDGSLHVIIEGAGKVRILQPLVQVPYLICKAELFEDSFNQAQVFPFSPLERLKSILQNWLKTNIEDKQHRKRIASKLSNADSIVDYICMFLVNDRDIKQILLETDSLTERLSLLHILFPLIDAQRENDFYSDIIKDYEDLEHIEAACQ